MDAAFLLAAIPEQAAVLGVILKPFSLGHLMLMKRIGSPFLPNENDSDTVAQTLQHFLLAVLICSDTYEAGVEQLYQLNDSKKTQATFKLWGKKCAGTNFQAQAKLFDDYLESAKIPDYYTKPKPQGGAKNGAPFWQMVFVQLLTRTNLTESQILNRPLAKTYVDFMTIAEIDGGLRLKTEDDIEIERRAKEYYEQIEASKPK